MGEKLKVSSLNRKQFAEVANNKKAKEKPFSLTDPITFGQKPGSIANKLGNVLSLSDDKTGQGYSITPTTTAIQTVINYAGGKLIGKALKTPIAKKVGEYLTTKTPLKNAYKLNPFASKPSPDKYYRTLGDKGLDDALKTKMLRANPAGDGTVSNTNINLSRPSNVPYFAKGEIGNYPGNNIVAETSKTLFKRGDINPVTKLPIKGRHWGYRNIDETGKAADLPLNEVKLLKKDWLKGYKEIPKMKKGNKKIKYNTGVQRIYNDTPDYSKVDARKAKTTANDTLVSGTFDGVGQSLMPFNPVAGTSLTVGNKVGQIGQSVIGDNTAGRTFNYGAKGAGAGLAVASSLGPMGMALAPAAVAGGAVLGAGYGLLTGNANDAKDKREKRKAERAVALANANKKFSETSSTDAQSSLAKKGKYKVKARVIESEGREPIFSPKKADGSRDLLYYNPNDPTHSQGGVKMAVTKKNCGAKNMKYGGGTKKLKYNNAPTKTDDYQTWKSKLPKNLQYEGDYDLKGFYKENPNFSAEKGDHMTDKFKLPNHPTFSNESKYYREGMKAGRWKEDKYVPISAIEPLTTKQASLNVDSSIPERIVKPAKGKGGKFAQYPEMKKKLKYKPSNNRMVNGKEVTNIVNTFAKGTSSIKAVIPEGSSIVTAEGSMNKAALLAYKNKDWKTLDRIINSMPEDKSNKKDDGVKNLISNPLGLKSGYYKITTQKKSKKYPTKRSSEKQKSMEAEADKDLEAFGKKYGKYAYQVQKARIEGQNNKLDKVTVGNKEFLTGSTVPANSSGTKPLLPNPNLPHSGGNPVSKKQYTEDYTVKLPKEENNKKKSFDWSSIPSIAEIAARQSLLNKGVDKVPENYVKFGRYKYASQLPKNLQENMMATNTAKQSVKNASGGNTGNYLSNVSNINTSRLKANNDAVINDTLARQYVLNKNVDVANEENKINTELKIGFNDAKAANLGAYRNQILAQGKSIDATIDTAKQNTEQKRINNILLKQLDTDNYTEDSEGNKYFKNPNTGKLEKITKEKKGAKNLKYKTTRK